MFSGRVSKRWQWWDCEWSLPVLQEVEKCFSREVQFLVTSRQSPPSTTSLHHAVLDGAHSPAASSVASPSPASPGLFRLTPAAGAVLHSSPAVSTATDGSRSLVCTYVPVSSVCFYGAWEARTTRSLLLRLLVSWAGCIQLLVKSCPQCPDCPGLC